MDHDRITINVHVHPGSRQRAVGGAFGSSLIVRVRSRAVDGAANEEVLTALAQAFGLRRHEVDFVRITRSRQKNIQLRGDASALTLRYRELLEP